MRNLISGALILFAVLINAQVAIEKTSVDGDGLLDFAGGTNKGIILPMVSSTPNVVEGTIVFDQTDKKVKYYNGAWVPLSRNSGSERERTNVVNDVATTDKGVVIGDDSTAAGILILESDNKALILPKVFSPELSVVKPEPGMMCYDLTTQRLSVFNGTKWEFWE